MRYKMIQKLCHAATFSLSAALLLSVPVMAESEVQTESGVESESETDEESMDEQTVEEGSIQMFSLAAAVQNGWVKRDDKWYYYENGEQRGEGWLQLDDNWYYLNADGSMKSDEVFLVDGYFYGVAKNGCMYKNTVFTLSSGKTYHAKKWGGLYTGFVNESNGTVFYSPEDGSLQNPGWITYKDQTYYLNEDHTLAKGFQGIDGVWYYFRDDNTLVRSEWIQYNNYWYYFHEDGSMYSGEFFTYNNNLYYARSWGGIYTNKQFTVDGKTYWAKSWGGLYTGDVTINGIFYRFDENGVLQNVADSWISKGEYTYYIKPDGTKAVDEWVSKDGRWYYCSANDGILLHDVFFEVKGKLYYAGSDGSIYQDTLFTVGDETYWARSWGGLYTGDVKINGITYHFNDNGVLLGAEAGWYEKDGQLRYCQSDGSDAVSMWLSLDDSWYYMDENGNCVRNQIFKIKNTLYYASETGEILTDQMFMVDGNYYYAKSWGGLYTGNATINGVEYQFDSNGVLISTTPHWVTIDDNWYYIKSDGSYAENEWVKIDGIWYYMGENGIMKSSEYFTYNGHWYYARSWGGIYTNTKFTADGKTCWARSYGGLYTGWFQPNKPDDTTYYYADENGEMLISSFFEYQGHTYYLTNTGAMAKGWQTIDGDTYYFASWGGMYTGTHSINGNTYTFDDDGKLIQSSSSSDSNYRVTDAEFGVKTLTNLLKNAVSPVGRTLYIWGGGHDSTGSYAGLYPGWEEFYNANDSSYNPDAHDWETGHGLDCSGFVGWTVYQCMQTSSVDYSYGEPSDYANRGWGSCTEGYSGPYTAGDVVARPGHVWMVIGSCSDGSVVIVHSSSWGVEISGTATPSGNYSSEASALASTYMNRYYPETMSRYNIGTGSASNYLNDKKRFTWSSSVMADPDGLRNADAAEVLRIIFNE